MRLFDIDYKKCNDCQKCIRSCGVKALHSNNRKVVLMPNFCIACGHCIDVCPQGCFNFVSELEKVKSHLAAGHKVVASVDSVYSGILTCEHERFVGALRSLGFYQVREVGEAAAIVSEEYFKYSQSEEMDNVLTTFCPAFVSLAEKHYPEVIDELSPVANPMIAHGKMIKKRLGADTIVAYISPCISFRELSDESSDVDAVLTFKEIKDWMISENIDIDNVPKAKFDNKDPMSNRLYPVSSGVIRAIEHQVGRDNPLSVVRERISINGVHNAREVLHAIKKGYVHNCFIEFHACAGGCCNGPCVEKDRGFAFIDVNMGCPVPKIVNNGEGSALMKNPKLIGDIVNELVNICSLPITIKIRAGFNEDSINAPEIAQIAESAGVSAIAVHGRTREQYYHGKADWNIIKAVKESVKVPVIGNGDVASAEDVIRIKKETGCDSVMIGRAAKGNPWLFADIKEYLKSGNRMVRPDINEICEMMLRHARLMIEYKGEFTGIHEMRKHVAWYTQGMKDSAKLRARINTVETYEELEKLISRLKD